MADSKTNGIIGLIGSVVFGVLGIIVPFLKLEGFGFITGTGVDFFWDEVSAGGVGIGYDLYLDILKLAGGLLGQEPTEILWTLIPLWGFVFLGVGLLGAVLVAIPAFQVMSGSDPMNTGFIGLIAGLVATVVEVALFAIVGILDKDLMGGGGDINFVLLALFAVSWVALIIGYIFVKKE